MKQKHGRLCNGQSHVEINNEQANQIKWRRSRFIKNKSRDMFDKILLQSSESA